MGFREKLIPFQGSHNLNLCLRYFLKGTKNKIQRKEKRFIRYLGHGVWIKVDPFRYEESHLSGRHITHGVEEDAPRPFIRGVTPSVRPTQDDCVRFHATQAARLDAEGVWVCRWGKKNQVKLYIMERKSKCYEY